MCILVAYRTHTRLYSLVCKGAVPAYVFRLFSYLVMPTSLLVFFFFSPVRVCVSFSTPLRCFGLSVRAWRGIDFGL